ncbi:DNA glycosylase AlkZ-like family protein [Pseudonocardia acidicola]|uniref:Winged helix DNA-binding domain-containing protein n=1 Tax=Pseudonocardia acidicola TaxID=2724939 RepID=A0ABX1SCW5_9PSEU|nr:winged helix DNA-binding domain-containing protein [Pseudonocardia acidicola]
MAERVSSVGTLDRALLARQLLLERVRAGARPRGGARARAADAVLPVGLWSRPAGFGREELTDALIRRRVVQGWVIRCTIHMVSAREFPLLTEAVRPSGGRGGCGSRSVLPASTCTQCPPRCAALWPTDRASRPSSSICW